MLSTVLIIDKRELAVKYKKSIDSPEVKTVIAKNLKDGMNHIQSLEPDMIIVSDSIEEEQSGFCKKIRSLTYNTRPVIVALSKSADSQDRINVLENGADDFISEPVNIEEFKTRINAHLRRDIELNLDDVTLLPNRKYVKKVLKRILSGGNHAVMHISIQNIEDYKSVYTEIAANKLIQTFVAIAKSALSEDDFLGQISETEFIIVTGKYSLEKISAFLTFAFDTVVQKFYKEQDLKRGYMIMNGQRSAGRRSEFVSALIGGMTEGFDKIPDTELLIGKLREITGLAKIPSGSNFIIERPQLTTANSVKQEICKSIYIKEGDDALNYLLRTTLELQGYNVKNEIDIKSNIQPSIVIIDSGNSLEELETVKKYKAIQTFANTVFIITTTVHDKETVLNAGADLYLPKPYEISDLIKWVEYFLK